MNALNKMNSSKDILYARSNDGAAMVEKTKLESDIPYLRHWKFGGESEVQKEYFYYIFTYYILTLTSSHHSVIHSIPPCSILLCSVQYFRL